MLKIGRYKHGNAESLGSYFQTLMPDLVYMGDGTTEFDTNNDAKTTFDTTIDRQIDSPTGNKVPVYSAGCPYVDNPIDFTSTAGYYLSFWIRFDTVKTSTLSTIVVSMSWGDDTAGSGVRDNYIFRINTNAVLDDPITWYNGSSSSIIVTTNKGIADIHDGQWHLCSIFNRPALNCAIYLDGITIYDATGFATATGNGQHLSFFRGFSTYTGPEPGGPIYGNGMPASVAAVLGINGSFTPAQAGAINAKQIELSRV